MNIKVAKRSSHQHQEHAANECTLVSQNFQERFQLIVVLKLDERGEINYDEDERNDCIIDGVTQERTFKCCKKRKAKTVENVARDVPDKNKSAQPNTYDEEAEKIHLAEILRIK